MFSSSSTDDQGSDDFDDLDEEDGGSGRDSGDEGEGGDWRSRLAGGFGAGADGHTSSYGYYDDDQPEPKEFNWFATVAAGADPSTAAGGGHAPHFGPASSWFRSPSLQQRRAPSTSSRASSIHSTRSSRRNSVIHSPGPTSPHPALHELVRENTTGGVVPSENVPIPGGATTTTTTTTATSPSPSEWEATNETYKPSVLATPRMRRATSPSSGMTDAGEEPFLESEPNSPRSPARLTRTKTYDSYASSASARGDDDEDDDDGHQPLNDLANVEVFDEGERVGVGVWLEGRGGYVRDCFAGRVDRDGKAPGNGLDGPKQLEVERRLGEGTYAIVYLVREVLNDPDPTLDDDDDVLSPIDPLASFEFDDSDSSRPRLHSWASDTWNPPPKPTYGQYYALKCLCKKNLTEDLIEVQRNEAFLHRALPKHDNIVQMYGVRLPSSQAREPGASLLTVDVGRPTRRTTGCSSFSSTPVDATRSTGCSKPKSTAPKTCTRARLPPPATLTATRTIRPCRGPSRPTRPPTCSSTRHPPHPRSSRRRWATNSCRGNGCGSSRACLVRCALPSRRATTSGSRTATSSPRTLSSSTARTTVVPRLTRRRGRASTAWSSRLPIGASAPCRNSATTLTAGASRTWLTVRFCSTDVLALYPPTH